MKPLPRARAVLHLLAVFLAGIVVGVTLCFAWWHLRPFRPPGSPEAIAAEITGRYRAELRLTDEQVGKFRPLAIEAGAFMYHLHGDVMTRVVEQFTRTHAQLASWLTPEQRERLRAFEERERRKFAPPADAP